MVRPSRSDREDQEGEGVVILPDVFILGAPGRDKDPQPLDDRTTALLLEQASAELREWGHSGHQIMIERADVYFADSNVLRCAFWCQTCHVAQVVLLPAKPD
jgi:hypothetical protein